jgi:hypothetical protein
MNEKPRVLGDLELTEIANAERMVRSMHFEPGAEARSSNVSVETFARWCEESPGYVRDLLATVVYWRNRATKN